MRCAHSPLQSLNNAWKVEANKIKSVLDLVGSVESYTLQAYRDALLLSDGLRVSKEKSPNNPPFSVNVLEHLKAPETFTSWIIRHLFAYMYEGRHPFFVSFAETFLHRIGFKPEWIDTPIIDKDHEYKNIDILVRDKQYAVIIENKLKGADFQLNQIARYIATIRNEGYSDDQIFVVVLPKNEISNDEVRQSVWKLPVDWQSTNPKRKCRTSEYTCRCDDDKNYNHHDHCSNCEPLKELFQSRTLFIHNELSEWLLDCVANNIIRIPHEELRKQYVLTSAALQFVDFLNFLYGTRENDKYKMDIQNFLSKQLNLDGLDILDQLSLVEDKEQDAKELESQLNTLYWNKIKEYIDIIGNKYHIHLIFEENDEYYFSCKIDFEGTAVNVMLGNDQDGEGDYCQIETKQRKKIPEIIRKDFDISEELNDKDIRADCIWKYDSYTESLKRFDKVLGRLFDLKNQLAPNPT